MGVTLDELIELRAELAMREVDTQYAFRMEQDAAALPPTPENLAQLERYRRWTDICRQREHEARQRLTRAELGIRDESAVIACDGICECGGSPECPRCGWEAVL